jgi:hypothetical protein
MTKIAFVIVVKHTVCRSPLLSRCSFHGTQSCSGCSLNRLHEVRRFVKQEAAYYEPQVKVKFIGWLPSVFVFVSC